MFRLFRAVIDRIKVLLATSAAVEREADALAQHAERKAELLRLAHRGPGLASARRSPRREAAYGLLDSLAPSSLVFPELFLEEINP